MRSAVHRLLLEALCAGVLVLSAAGTNAPTTTATTTDSPSSAPTSTGSPTTGSPTTLPPIRGPTGSPTGGPTSHPTIDKCSLAKTDSGIDDGRFNWPTLNAPYESLATALIALAFLPAIGVASIYGAPRRVRVLWAWFTGGRGPEVEPILPEEEMSFWSLAGSDMSIRRKEARRSWSENWFRGARDRQRLSNDLGEPLLDLKPDEEWEEAPEFVPDDDYSVVFTHALRPGTVYEPDSACWQPSPELLESGIEIEEATPLNCLERLFSCRAGSMLDQYVGWLLPHLDTAVAQRRSNLYRPLYYKAKDVRWCPGAIHKTYRNVLSKPDFQEKASEQSIKTSHERALLSYLPELRALEQLYSVAFYFSVILFVLMLPLIFDGMTDNSTDVYFKDQGIQDRVKFQTYVLWRTSWINADDPDGHSWRDGWIRFVLTMRMLMLAAVLLWACFRHSAHDVMIDHPIGMDDFTVEVGLAHPVA